MKRLPRSAAEFTSAQPEIERDRWGRPLVVPPQGGKAVGYTRCTTFVGTIDDTWNLSRWTQRLVARGVAERDDIRAAVLDADPNDSRRLDDLCEEAKEASGGNDAARLGTYMHAVTEAADTGGDPAAVPLPPLAKPREAAEFAGDLAAYMAATEALQAVAVEQFSVLDTLMVGGTPDRVVGYQGKRYIADLKTGSIEWGTLKIAAQLAVYARSRPYDVATGQRLDPHGAETNRGIVIHAPIGTGTCTLYWVDLLAGWEAVRLSKLVRDQRKQRFRDLATALDFTADVPSEPVQDGDTLVSLPEQVGSRATTIADLITHAPDRDSIAALWRAHAADWTEAHTQLAKARIAALT